MWRLLVLLFVASPLHADQWTWFHPEFVTNIGYKIEVVERIPTGAKAGDSYYVCHAYAKRNDPSLGDWEATMGEFPVTVKGRHAAEKVCSKWMDEAGRRVKAAR